MILTKPSFNVTLQETIKVPGAILGVYKCSSEEVYINGRNLIDYHESNFKNFLSHAELVSALKDLSLTTPQALTSLKGKPSFFLPFETSRGVISTFFFNEGKNMWEFEDTWADPGHPGPLYMIISERDKTKKDKPLPSEHQRRNNNPLYIRTT